MKIGSLLKIFAIFVGLGLAGFASLSLFLHSETGRQWAQREALDWIKREYGLAIQFQSLEFRNTVFGWHLTLKRVLWKLQPLEPVTGQEFPGQPIDELQLVINPLALALKRMPIAELRIKGLFLRPTLSASGILLRGAGLRLDQAMLAQLRSGSSRSGTATDWPTIRVDDLLMEIEDSESLESAHVPGLTSVRIAGEWTEADGLRDLRLASPRIELVRFGHQAIQLGDLFGIPALSSNTRSLLSVMERGGVEGLEVRCQDLTDCVGSALVRNLQWKEKNFLPGLHELSARVEFKRTRIEIMIPHNERTLTWSRLYSHPIPINFFGTRIIMVYEDDGLNLDIPQTRIEWNRLPLDLRAQLKLPFKDLRKTFLQLQVRNPSARWDEVKAVLPNRFLGPELMHVLDQRLRKGHIHALVGELKGPLLEFPFASQKSGLFAINADFSALQLSYLDHWPALNKCQGHLQIKGSSLGIDQLACQSESLTVNQGKLEIPDFLADAPRLQVTANVQGSLDASLNFLGQTPLSSIKKLVHALGVKAPLQQTKLALTIPLKKNAAASGAKIQGETSVPSAELTLPGQLLTGRLHQFKLNFDQDGLDNLTAEIDHQNKKSKLVVHRNGTHLDLDLRTPADSAGLAAELRLSPAESPQRIEGSVRGLNLQQGAAQLSTDSLVWQGPDKPFQFKGQAIVHDLGRIGPMLGFGEEFQAGRGKVNFDLRLPGNLEIKNAGQLAGSLDFDFKDGSIEKLSSTSMALINIANLKVFGLNSRNLSYTFLKGRLLFDQGTLATEDSTIGLGAVEIKAKGSIHYPTDSLNLELTIIPDLGSPAASLAIGLWNPLVGLGLYGYSKIHNKASDSRLNRLASQSYRMKGPIAKPEISLISILHLKEILPWTHSKDQTGESQ